MRMGEGWCEGGHEGGCEGGYVGGEYSPRKDLMRAFPCLMASSRWDSSKTNQLMTSILWRSAYEHTHTHTHHISYTSHTPHTP